MSPKLAENSVIIRTILWKFLAELAFFTITDNF